MSMKAAKNWKELNSMLKVAEEDDCKRMLDAEQRGPRRVYFLLRIHGRWARLRTQREREELMAGN